MRKYLIQNMIKEKRPRNSKIYDIPIANNIPRYSSNIKNEVFNNYTQNNNNVKMNHNLVNNNIIRKNMKKEYTSSTIENNSRKNIRHYQSRDSLNDQLNLIKFKMSCDLIGQKINQLKTFVDYMKNNDEEESNKQINLLNQTNQNYYVKNNRCPH